MVEAVTTNTAYMAKTMTKKPTPMTGGKAKSQKLQVPPQGSPVMKRGGKAKKMC